MAECVYIPRRYIFIFLAHTGFIVLYSLRVDLSVEVVAMVNSTYANVKSSIDPECSNGKNETVHSNVSL